MAADVDEAVEALPARTKPRRCTEAAVEVAASGTSSTKAAKPTKMNLRFVTSATIGREAQALVEPDVRREVQARVEEREEPEHPPQADRPRPAEDLAQRACRRARRRAGRGRSGRARSGPRRSGLAPSVPRAARASRIAASGTSAPGEDRGLQPGAPSGGARCGGHVGRSEVPAQVHAGVEPGDLLGVAVERAASAGA